MREERWRDAVHNADVEGGEVRKSEEEEVEVSLAPPAGSLRASQWKRRHGPLQFQLEWPTALHWTDCDSASTGWMNHSESRRRLQPWRSFQSKALESLQPSVFPRGGCLIRCALHEELLQLFF